MAILGSMSLKLGASALIALVALSFVAGCGSGPSAATVNATNDKFKKMDKDPNGDKGSP